MTKTHKRRVPQNLRPDGFRWSLMIACNDYRNGRFQGWAEFVEIGGGRGNFTFGTDYINNHNVSLAGPRVNFQCGKTRARIGALFFEHREYKEWVGNWCWDACFVERETVRKIGRMLKARGWTVESSSGLLLEWFGRLQ